jgi:uncharacterized protein (TIGR02147 family)
MNQTRPSIYEYSDFRVFLKDLYSHYKESDRHFSQRFIADKVKATSSGWFSDIVSGRISLTGAYIPKITKVMKMNNQEADFFKLLVDCNQASTLEEKNIYLETLLAVKKSGSVVLSKEQFDYYSKWYYPAIRELLFFYDFTDDYQKLAKLLKPSIRPADAKNAITILANLGLIAPDPNGFLKPVDIIVKKDPSFGQIYWANYQKAALALSSDAIERHAKDERDISSVIFCLSPESMEKAKHEIGKLRKKLLALSETDIKRDRVFQCNIQLFPVTKKQVSVKEGI